MSISFRTRRKIGRITLSSGVKSVCSACASCRLYFPTTLYEWQKKKNKNPFKGKIFESLIIFCSYKIASKQVWGMENSLAWFGIKQPLCVWICTAHSYRMVFCAVMIEQQTALQDRWELQGFLRGAEWIRHQKTSFFKIHFYLEQPL